MACARCLAQAEEGGLWIRSLHKALGRGGLGSRPGRAELSDKLRLGEMWGEEEASRREWRSLSVGPREQSCWV